MVMPLSIALPWAGIRGADIIVIDREPAGRAVDEWRAGGNGASANRYQKKNNDPGFHERGVC